MSKSETARKIRVAALLDLEIKAKTTELNELKEQLRPILAAGDTYIGEAATTVQVKPNNTFIAAKANAEFGSIPEATEPKVTPASLKAYLEKKYAGKPKKVQAKLDEFYTRSTSLTFGVQS